MKGIDWQRVEALKNARQWRRRYAKPRLEVFHQWLLLQQAQAAPNSGLRKVLDYTLKRWPALLRYLDDGRVPIDNNRCENGMRPVAARTGSLQDRCARGREWRQS